MVQGKLRVGVIGASPERGWFTWAHLPALRALSDRIEITAVCTTRMTTASAAQDITGARWAFDNQKALMECDDVDLAVVCVKTPLHQEVSESAIAAGKAVYCEWPLGRTVAEAESITQKAKTAAVSNIIGLQGRASPIINTVRELVREGYVGKLLSTSIIASATAWDSAIDPAQTYVFDQNTGASMIRIVGGHLIDALCYTCGEFREVGARVANRRGRTAILGMAELGQLKTFSAILEPEDADTSREPEAGYVRAQSWFTPTSPDHLALHGVLDNGALATVHIHSGTQRGTNLHWTIIGDEGELQVTGDAGVLQIVDLTLKGGRGRAASLAPLPVLEPYRASMKDEPGGAASNVWRLYKAYLGDDTPAFVEIADFEAALKRQRLIEAIETAAAQGRHQIVA